MESNTVERAIKTETDTRTEKKKEWTSSVSLCQRDKLQHPYHVKVSPWGLDHILIPNIFLPVQNESVIYT